MSSIHPSRASLEALVRHFSPDEPVVMLNLLRFREQAVYSDDENETACTGREAYARYSKQALPHLEKVGAKAEWVGEAMTTVIGPDEEGWHDVLLVRYPSAEAFLAMVGDPEYQAVVHHRTAALADSRLIATRPKKF
ncbi:hypothetical protein RE428_15420 [Marinobacter nanhaiticus D15-8W]|uniref:DUF1330 domain-containing protein n=1 Tax=Marinobacter nanhaiticus D15-8W TaxID=626887 RepID=N6VZ63_9GAMM|nr:DUF1330 domain-containing protein [Marinobacter nanhaiticus]ENO13164.1 DUF1330 domain-containing protein [Marinobacter nanhaiticus D15-8W]BES70524.1 hypothetical protein RE428_15420 [Marinobacter nanhaiticus D15-8W]